MVKKNSEDIEEKNERTWKFEVLHLPGIAKRTITTQPKNWKIILVLWIYFRIKINIPSVRITTGFRPFGERFVNENWIFYVFFSFLVWQTLSVSYIIVVIRISNFRGTSRGTLRSEGLKNNFEILHSVCLLNSFLVNNWSQHQSFYGLKTR